MRVRSSLVPLCIASYACVTAPDIRSIGCPADVGPKGHPPFLGRIFRACTKPVTGPVLHSLPHVLHHTSFESGRTPGLPASPGWISVTGAPEFRVSLLRRLLRSPSSGDFPVPQVSSVRTEDSSNCSFGLRRLPSRGYTLPQRVHYALCSATTQGQVNK